MIRVIRAGYIWRCSYEDEATSRSFAAVGGGERIQPGIPRPGDNLVADGFRGLVPIGSARRRVTRARAAMRSAAAQDMRLEKVCGLASVRYSQMPASGVPASVMALRVSRSSSASDAGVRSALKRSSKNTGASASTISPKMSCWMLGGGGVADAHRPSPLKPANAPEFARPDHGCRPRGTAGRAPGRDDRQRC